MPDKPSVLFLCIHNAGRSQMAAAYLSHLAGGAIEVRSAGSAPAERVNPSAVAAMADVGDELGEAAERDETNERSYVLVIEATGAMLQGIEKAKAARQALDAAVSTAARM